MIKLKKLLATVVCFAMILAMSACDNSSKDGDGTSDATTATTEPIIIENPMVFMEVKEGDVYAINKFSVEEKTGGYQLAASSQEQQAKGYSNLTSQVTVRACNYMENGKDVTAFTDWFRSNWRDNNMVNYCDTVFGEKYESTVAGFDAVNYDADVIRVQIDPETQEKTEVGGYKARITCFFSDEDIYYMIFESPIDGYDEQLEFYEEFLDGIVIDKNAKNIEETEDAT